MILNLPSLGVILTFVSSESIVTAEQWSHILIFHSLYYLHGVSTMYTKVDRGRFHER